MFVTIPHDVPPRFICFNIFFFSYYHSFFLLNPEFNSNFVINPLILVINFDKSKYNLNLEFRENISER